MSTCAFRFQDGAEADNSCVLVWEGETKDRAFGEARMVKEFNTVNIQSHFVSLGEDQAVPHRELRARLFQETWRGALLGSGLQRGCIGSRQLNIYSLRIC